MAEERVFDCGDEAGRLDRFLADCLPQLSRTRVQALIRAGAVRINGSRAGRPSAALRTGDRVEVELAPPEPTGLEPEAIPLEVLYEDADLAVVNKPAGLLVHPGAGQRRGTLVHALLHRYREADGLSRVGGAGRPGIVHRLDRFTSGVMVVARNDRTHRKLAEQFQARQVAKTYLALVHGVMASGAGEVRLPIRRDRHHRVRMTARPSRTESGREARTSYRVLETFPAPRATPAARRAACSYCWLEVCIHTGRTHQIRTHMAALGHPVVGDRLYGAAAALAGPGGLAGLKPPRPMLHAADLAFQHPETGEAMHFAAPLPAEMAEILRRLQAEANVEK